MPERQENEQGRWSYMALSGSFIRAYGNAAFALHRATGYQVIRLGPKSDVLRTGFPSHFIEVVCRQLREHGAEVEKVSDQLWRFRGIDDTPDLSLVVEPKPRRKAKDRAKSDKPVEVLPVEVKAVAPAHPPETPDYGWLAEAVRNFNLSAATPIDVVCFVSRLQQQLAS